MKIKKFKEKKKVNTYILILIILIGTTGGYLLTKTFSKFIYETEEIPLINGKVKFSSADIIFDFYKDNQRVETMPDKESGYSLDTKNSKCNNKATIVWDNNEWGPNIRNLSKTKTTCELYFIESNFDITDMQTPTESGDGLYKVVNSLKGWETPEYRFAGKNVKNYVKFNDEIWRIIGKVNAKTSTGEIEQRLKIIRQNGISGQKDFGNYAWDRSENFTNEWTTSRLKEMLNSSYYNSASGTCYTGTQLEKASQSTCNFDGSGTLPRGLNEKAREMIDDDVIWNIGGYNSNWETAEKWYEYERTKEWSISNDATYHKGVGLMYPTDYGYAVGGDVRKTCLTSNMYDYKNNSCANNDWLYQRTENWVISPVTDSGGKGAYPITSEGSLYNYGYNTSLVRGVWPVVYLKSIVHITGGEGTIENPYTLST